MMKNGYLLLCATALSLILNVVDRHTQHTPNLSARSLSSPFSEKREFKVAQVCWITDTDDCGGADFVGTDGTTGTPPEILPPGGDDYKESCTEMGYGKIKKAVPKWAMAKPHARQGINQTNSVR